PRQPRAQCPCVRRLLLKPRRLRCELRHLRERSAGLVTSPERTQCDSPATRALRRRTVIALVPLETLERSLRLARHLLRFRETQQHRAIRTRFVDRRGALEHRNCLARATRAQQSAAETISPLTRLRL